MRENRAGRTQIAQEVGKKENHSLGPFWEKGKTGRPNKVAWKRLQIRKVGAGGRVEGDKIQRSKEGGTQKTPWKDRGRSRARVHGIQDLSLAETWTRFTSHVARGQKEPWVTLQAPK